MLAVVEHQQCPPSSQILDEGLLDGQMLTLLHIYRRRNRGNGRRCIAHWGELGHEDLAVELVPQVAGEPQRKPCRLADSPGTRQRDQSIASAAGRASSRLIGTTDELGGLGWGVAASLIVVPPKAAEEVWGHH